MHCRNSTNFFEIWFYTDKINHLIIHIFFSDSYASQGFIDYTIRGSKRNVKDKEYSMRGLFV